MPEIVDAGLVACSVMADKAGVLAQLAEDTVDPAIA
jgi:hypothetical protein